MRKLLTMLTCGLLLSFPFGLSVSAHSIYDSPYVEWSSTGEAWTFQDRGIRWYPGGTTVKVNGTGSRPELQEGQHYYGTKEKTVPVSQWTVRFETHNCIHNTYPKKNPWLGVDYNQHNCFGKNDSGWVPTCAICGEEFGFLFYGSKEAIASLDSVENDSYFYFLCPNVLGNGERCNNLEQGTQINHRCKSEVSYNRYEIWYEANGGAYFISPSYFMYNNATEYKGRPITPETKLKRGIYQRYGYVFAGWNTERDGSGISLEDEAEIYNFTKTYAEAYGLGAEFYNKDEQKITLYGQWKPAYSTLAINPNGGSYDGNRGLTCSYQRMGETYTIDPDKLVPPAGNLVTFDHQDEQGTLTTLTGKRSFQCWQEAPGFLGELADNVYTFGSGDETTDTLTAIYWNKPIILPLPAREGYSFGGWHADEACTMLVGMEGEKYIPTTDTTLYAKWVDLKLIAVDNYQAFKGTGAVDLEWSQPDGRDKTYKIYQSLDQVNWSLVNTATSDTDVEDISLNFGYIGAPRTYTVPSSGYYTLAAAGAQGGNYGSYTGGKGGYIEAKVWLKAGETLTIEVGGQNAYHGGGRPSTGGYSTGGGYTSMVLHSKEADRNGQLLLIAGGGGGATSAGHGKAGGYVVEKHNDIDGLLSTRGDMVDGGTSGKSGLGAGGGGGYFGGNGGEQLVHYHSGSSTSGGGCYGISVRCGGGMNTHSQPGEIGGWYCGRCAANGNSDCTGSSVVCGQCGYGGPGHCKHAWYYPGKTTYTCSKCGLNYGSTNPGSCTRVTSYALNCTYKNYPSGYVYASYPAYGGTSYVNTALVLTSSYTVGSISGNGKAIVLSKDNSYVESNSLAGVKATDKEPPDKVSADSFRLTPAGESRAAVTWAPVRDNGTVYYHKAASYQYSLITGAPTTTCVSNVTKNTLVSDVIGYYYAVDPSPEYEVTAADFFTVLTNATIEFPGGDTYFHVAAVDKAGNLSATTHFYLKRDEIPINWAIYTGPVSLYGDHVYQSPENGDYYVKAGTDFPFTMSFSGYMREAAMVNYQIDQIFFSLDAMAGAQKYQVTVPKAQMTDQEVRYSMGDIQKEITEPVYVLDAPYTAVTRSNSLKHLCIEQQFTANESYNGTALQVSPGVSAKNDTTGEVTESNKEEDKTHGVKVIIDAEGPVIDGLDKLKDLTEIDREAAEIILELAATDALSGLKSLEVSIINLDNQRTRNYFSSDGKLTINITEEDLLFTGEFAFSVIATDNVGNTTSYEYNLQEFTLNTQLERKFPPEDKVFKAGECGILTIVTTGYVDKLNIQFPWELTQHDSLLNKTYTYSYDEEMYDENLELRQNGRVSLTMQFIVPTKTAEGDYEIKITAYKDGEQVQVLSRVEPFTVKGSIYDDIKSIIIETN